MIRVKWGLLGASLQTAVTTLRERGMGRRVVLVSAIHVARPQYYTRIDRLVAAHEHAGGAVLYEGLGSLTEGEIAELSDEERAIYRSLAPLHDLYRALARSLDLVFQGEALRYDRERWLNADLSLRELVRRWAEAGAPILPLGAAGRGDLGLASAHIGRRTGGLLLLLTPALLRLFGGLSRRLPAIGRLRELLVSDRNRAALDALESIDPRRDAVIIYGAGHIAELVEGLERRGYTIVHQSWLTAFVWHAPWARAIRGGGRSGTERPASAR